MMRPRGPFVGLLVLASTVLAQRALTVIDLPSDVTTRAAVNSAAEDASPWLSASGEVLLFASNRPGGAGGWDLYASRHVNGDWQAPRNLGAPINTADDESAVSLSAADDRLYFSRMPLAPPRTRRLYSAPFAISDIR